MKILVTGGAGFIGSNFIRRTLENSIKDVSSVIVLDKLTYAGLKSNLPPSGQNDFEFVQGDICDQDLVDKVVGKSDVVINFAAESHVDRSITGSRDFILTNVLGTHTLLEAAKKHEVKTFIQVSTDEIYGSILSAGVPLSGVCPSGQVPDSPYYSSRSVLYIPTKMINFVCDENPDRKSGSCFMGSNLVPTTWTSIKTI